MSDPITCPCCGGEGSVDLAAYSWKLAATLSLLRENGPQSATTLGQLTGAEVTAMNMRLERLRELGLATRRKRGREWLYEATGR